MAPGEVSRKAPLPGEEDAVESAPAHPYAADVQRAPGRAAPVPVAVVAVCGQVERALVGMDVEPLADDMRTLQRRAAHVTADLRPV